MARKGDARTPLRASKAGLGRAPGGDASTAWGSSFIPPTRSSGSTSTTAETRRADGSTAAYAVAAQKPDVYVLTVRHVQEAAN
jgi:hypothetical protein